MSVLFQTTVFFFSSVVYTFVEYFYSILKNDSRYNLEEIQRAIYNGLVLVVTETTSVVLFVFLTKKLYGVLWGSIPATTFAQIFYTIVIIDFLYYVYHRVHHHRPKLYTIHRIHHVGKKYNLSLALMLPWVGQASIYVMFIPLIFFRISPSAIISAYFFLLTYQLCSHISYLQVPKWFDVLLVTPRSHRIHHYSDRESQTHNYGAVFSLWDRGFGTYSESGKGPNATYGVIGYEGKNIFAMQKETVMQFFTK